MRIWGGRFLCLPWGARAGGSFVEGWWFSLAKLHSLISTLLCVLQSVFSILVTQAAGPAHQGLPCCFISSMNV